MQSHLIPCSPFFVSAVGVQEVSSVVVLGVLKEREHRRRPTKQHTQRRLMDGGVEYPTKNASPKSAFWWVLALIPAAIVLVYVAVSTPMPPGHTDAAPLMNQTTGAQEEQQHHHPRRADEELARSLRQIQESLSKRDMRARPTYALELLARTPLFNVSLLDVRPEQDAAATRPFLNCHMGDNSLDNLCMAAMSRMPPKLTTAPPIASKSAKRPGEAMYLSRRARRRKGRVVFGDIFPPEVKRDDEGGAVQSKFLLSAANIFQIETDFFVRQIAQLIHRHAMELQIAHMTESAAFKTRRNQSFNISEQIRHPLEAAPVRRSVVELMNDAVAVGDVQVVSASLVTWALQQVQEDGLFRQERLHNLFRSAKSTYVVQRGRGRGQLGFLLDMPPPPTCNVTRLRPRGGSTAVLRVECMSLAAPANAMKPLCADIAAGQLMIVKMLRTPPKTGVYEGLLGDSHIVLKHFNAAHYASFDGFHQLVSHPLRSPLVNIPVGACADPAASDSVFQAQRFVEGQSLYWYVRDDPSRITWQIRIELAMQITCAMRFLHTHPLGVFAFDDNHPEQYMVTPSANNTLPPKLTMVDLDSVQLMHPDTDGVTSEALTLRNYSGRCRCFHCHGKAACMFENTLDGYHKCKQNGEGMSGDVEVTADPDARCDASADMWFLGQLLVFLVHGRMPWERYSLTYSLHYLSIGVVPVIPSNEPDFDNLVRRVLVERIETEAVLELLQPLCTRYHCRITQCPATYFASSPFSGLRAAL